MREGGGGWEGVVAVEIRMHRSKRNYFPVSARMFETTHV